MKRNAVVIYLVLLMACNYCYCDDDSESSEEFHEARGCSQRECGQATMRVPTRPYKTDQSGIALSINYEHKGSIWTVTNSQKQEHLDFQTDSPVNDKSRWMGCRSYRLVIGNYRKRLKICDTDEVTGNEKPQTEGNNNNNKQTRKTTTTMTPEPDYTVHSNAFLTPYERSRGGDNSKVSQDDDQENHEFLPSSPDCGLSLQDRIVGGMQSTVGKWPWMVAYGFRDKQTTKEFVWMCGGSLVTEKHTITVAHCLMSPTHYIDVARIGDVQLNLTLDETSVAEEREVNRRVLIHPRYSAHSRTHDIAIVTVKKPFSKRYKPICLPFQRDMRNKQFIGKDAYVAGWGATDIESFSSNVLLDVKLPIVDNQKCSEYYGSKRVEIDSSHICAGGETGKDSCRGDSGGPLMIKNETSYFLVGVVAFGTVCGSQGAPGVYTRITSHLDWLEEHLRNKTI